MTGKKRKLQSPLFGDLKALSRTGPWSCSSFALSENERSVDAVGDHRKVIKGKGKKKREELSGKAECESDNLKDRKYNFWVFVGIDNSNREGQQHTERERIFRIQGRSKTAWVEMFNGTVLQFFNTTIQL